MTVPPGTVRPVSLDEIRAARERIRGSAVRTPLLRLELGEAPHGLWLKLENLQPIGSFKLRGAGNAMALADRERLARGVYTASAGNMAQGVAWNARRMGVPCHVVVPETAPLNKVRAVERMGATVVQVPFARWWQVLMEHRYPELDGHLFIHPVSDPAVIAGNGTLGLEILEDLPDVDAVVVPFGGGGLSCGIACALRASRPGTPVYAAEVETAAPLAASLAAGAPVDVDHRPSFVDGIGSKGVLREMWPLAREVLAGSLVSTLEEVAGAVRLLAERSRVVAEGAGAVAVAAALAGKVRADGGGARVDATTGAADGRRHNVVCIVSGGNIDSDVLCRILGGEVPGR